MRTNNASNSGDFASKQKKISVAWQALTQRERSQFQTKAADLRRKRNDKLHNLWKQQQKRHQEEEEEEEKMQQQQESQPKRPRESRKKPNPKRRRIVLSAAERRRVSYNKIMGAEREKLKRSYLAFFARFTEQLRPFVTKTVLNLLKKVHKNDLAKAIAAAVDVNAPPNRSQPECITGGTMRGYQLKSLEWLLSLHEQGSACIGILLRNCYAADNYNFCCLTPQL